MVSGQRPDLKTLDIRGMEFEFGLRQPLIKMIPEIDDYEINQNC